MKKFSNKFWNLIICGIILGITGYVLGTEGSVVSSCIFIVWSGICLWVPFMLPEDERYRQQ